MATYLTHSISESFHASLIAQQHDQRKPRTDLSPTDEDHDSKGDGENKGSQKDDMSLCVQCLLVMVFVGIELTSSFTVIYSVLFLQFLGVPTSLVSLAGVICGSSTFVLLPIIGWFSDRGLNPVKRKIGILGIGFSAYTLGLVGLGFCSAMRLHPTNTFQTNSTTLNTNVGFNILPGHNEINATVLVLESHQITQTVQFATSSQSNLTVYPISSLSADAVSNGTHINEDDRELTANNQKVEFTYISVIGILSFAVLDMAFDACMSICRAFVLECSPPSLHPRLLMMATAFGAISSCLMGFVATFDIPGALGRVFSVDGTPAAVLVFSFAVFLVLIFSFACTAITGYVLTRGKYKDAKEIADIPCNVKQTSGRYYKKRSKNSLSKHSLTKISTESINRRTSPAEPLLPPSYKQSKHSYHTIGSRSYEEQNSLGKNLIVPHRLTEDESNILHENKVLDITYPYKNNDGDDCDGNSDTDSEYSSGSRSESEDDLEESQPRNTRIPSLLSGFINSYSYSVSIIQSNRIASESLETLKRKGETPETSDSKPRSIFKNKRLMILCVSVFFSMGAMLCFNQYGGNTLTIGIYHGDPTGIVGSPARQMYDKGIRQAALGFLICYLMYSAASVFTKKLIDLVGENGQYILCQIALSGLDLALVLVQTEEVYFVTAAMSGFYRACPFTLGYILANKFVQEDSVGDGKSPTKNVGQVMVLIGMMMPMSYLTISSFMGPLMSVTNNAFVPIMCGGVCAALALLTFCLLFVVRK